MNLSVRTPDELLAAVPHLLGFQPDESLVFVPVRSALPVARVDFPRAPGDSDAVWQSVRDGLSRYAEPGAAVCVLCLTGDRQSAQLVSRELASRLETLGIVTQVRLWADETQWCDLDSGEYGPRTEAARERVAALAVLNGRAQPMSSREALEASLVGDRQPVANILPKVREASSPSKLGVEGRWALRRLEQFHADGVRLSDRDAARLLVGIESIPIRDRLWNDMTRSNAGSHVALWTDLTRRAPDEVRAAPASMLGFSSWLSGDGARAWCALDQVPRDGPYALADLVAAAIQGGMHPREWEVLRSPTSSSMDCSTDPIAQRPSTQLGHARPAPEI